MQRAIAKAVRGNQVLADGRWLTCIGNKNVKAGDLIWTDGRCVYGNQAEGGSGCISVMPQETFIPVLLQGSYYAGVVKGKLQKFCQGNNHSGMVNQKRKTDFLDKKNLLDAEMDEQGNVYTMSTGEYHYNTNMGFHMPNYFIADYHGDINITAVHYPYPDMTGHRDDRWSSAAPEKVVCRDADIDGNSQITEKNTPIELCMNETILRKIDFQQYMQAAEMEEKAKKFAQMAQNYMAQAGGAEFPADRPCPGGIHLKRRYANVLDGNIAADGSWNLIVETGVEMHFFPWISYRNPRYHLEVYNLWAGKILGDVNRYIHKEKLTPYGGMVKSWLKGTAAYIERIKITQERIEVLSCRLEARLDSLEGVCGQYLFDGVGELPGDLSLNAPSVFGDGMKVWDTYWRVSVPNSGFWYTSCYGCMEMDEETIPHILTGQVEHIRYTRTDAYHHIISLDETKTHIFKRQEENLQPSRFPLQDGYSYEISSEGDMAIFYYDTQQLFSCPHQAGQHYAVCQMGNSQYLLAVYGGNLYQYIDGHVTCLAADVRNYRLRKMNNLSRWKKERG